MDELLDADLWQGMLVEEVLEWQPTMFQPIGGMDRIPYAFASRLDSVIRYGAEVSTHSPVGLRRHRHLQRRLRRARRPLRPTTASARCRSPSRARSTPTSARPFATILDTVRYDSAYKIAWEAPRFWERETNIFGGISYLQQPIDLVWYPSARFFSEKGVVIGGYSIEEPPSLGALPDLLGEDRASLRVATVEWVRIRPAAVDAGQARRFAPVD